MRKSYRWIFITAIVLAIAALLVWAFLPKPVPVEVAKAANGQFEIEIEEDAKTRLRDRYVISAPLTGRLNRISFREGDEVKANAVVANMTPSMPAMLDARTSRELSIRVETADAMISRASARIERARVALNQAKNQLRRSEEMFRTKYVSAAQVENERLAVSAAQRELESANEDRHVATHEAEQARAALQASQQPDSRRESGFQVRAPIGGQVLRVMQPSETVVAIGTPLLDIGDTAELEVVAELLTTDAIKAIPGATVKIERWGGPTALQGKVREVEPAAFTKISALGVEEQRVNVLIDITSPREQWKTLGDGYRAGVRIVIVSKENVLRAPVSAVFPSTNSDNSKTMAVYVLRNGRAVQVPVEVGGRNGSDAWIRAGLKAGDQVIIYPGNSVRDGVRVIARSIETKR
jgi:HlyD family secretion protein